MGDTYVFFTSDNGWQEGEHRLDFGKWRPYEEDVRVLVSQLNELKTCAGSGCRAAENGP